MLRQRGTQSSKARTPRNHDLPDFRCCRNRSGCQVPHVSDSEQNKTGRPCHVRKSAAARMHNCKIVAFWCSGCTCVFAIGVLLLEQLPPFRVHAHLAAKVGAHQPAQLQHHPPLEKISHNTLHRTSQTHLGLQFTLCAFSLRITSESGTKPFASIAIYI